MRLASVVSTAVSLFATAHALPNSLTVMSYNIMNGGFGSLSGKWDPQDRVPGNLTDYVRSSVAPHYRVLGIVEAKGWTETPTGGHPTISEIAKAWGYEHYWHSGNELAFMSHDPIKFIELAPGPMCGAAVVDIENVTYIQTCLGDYATSRLPGAQALASIVKKYADRPTLVMGDFNGLSPQDLPRYNVTYLCQEYPVNYCLVDGAGKSYLESASLQTVLDAGLTDLCWLDGDAGKGPASPATASQCSNSNPTPIIHWWTGERPLQPTAKIDYIFANAALLQHYRTLHSRVVINAATDGSSDHYPVEATFAAL
eukprot:TRINITY_DN10863_c0_g1_i1.p1 TRINITY_DN10863_c0_g1~~TRINITY_DN10863_c0_g1_i1.p1  ORF type:complete len:312 (+),score=75.06 TRINITY_DN10863_c0_g1_i1:55-990(+)